uniref:Uncharacterized protein n=1 Tax=Percolomonas cosmopolitus TaxID=63605 RepID=A0A7S1KT13_9EUKA|mmetsp:Transcript_7740/g.29018  ORF Transcript_7740/g.29018 Transcript_7740/m.29018 type:complete len:127 (+) Transcript_7740:52-432(+)|eukprot:CAMPEP_0117450760 /NCGR_PEP_ID=MMETSP0759-20121206/8641_1 /TAXON_ID=63605 /ORGANISM="Percolomonas cosmopolitus, Strain WS" /LENGTH=126 /DNA_ID=CAMNT_0005243305 /DNA_START=10 /DNA_END=390 /DNA_ORIENTATION=-
MSFPKQFNSKKASASLPSINIPKSIPILTPLFTQYFPNARFARIFPVNLYYYTKGLTEFLVRKNKGFAIGAITLFAIFETTTYIAARSARTGDNGRYEKLFYQAEKRSKAQIQQLYSSVGLDPEAL